MLMLEMLRDLSTHKGHANATLLNAIHVNDAAAGDPEMWSLLHHIYLANRFWLHAAGGTSFVLDEESRLSESFDHLIERFQESQEEEEDWFDRATEKDLGRLIADPMIPGGTCTIAQAWMQVFLHSHGHRAQCAKLLRSHGGLPPTTDFILWLAGRPAAEWPEESIV